MLVRSLIVTAFAAGTFAAGGGAFSQTGPLGQEGGQSDTFTPAKRRSDVQSELKQFGADYPVSPWSFSYNPLVEFKSTQTRANVTAAFVADHKEAAALTGEDSGSVFLAVTRSAPTAGNLASIGDGVGEAR